MRYLITENLWGHIFSGTHETMTRFVFDRETSGMVAVQLMDGATGGWTDASAAETADLLDSLVDANVAALEQPAVYGLAPADDLPEWARPAPAPTV